MDNTNKNRNSLHLKIARVLGLLLGAVFTLSFIGKVDNADGFALLIVRYGFPSFSNLAPLIIVFEALCALCLLLNVYPKIASAIAGLMLICFTGAFYYANIHEGITNCGCFGNLVEDIPVWVTYLRNAILLLASISVFVLVPTQYTKSNSVRWIIIATSMTIVVYKVGNSYEEAPRYKEAHTLYNQPIKNTALYSYVKTDVDSTYLFYVFSYDCTTCLDGLNNIKEYDSRDIADRFIGMPVTEDRDSLIHKAFKLSFPEINVGLGLRGSVSGIPVILYVKNDTIKYVIEGSIPSKYNFKKYYLENEQIH